MGGVGGAGGAGGTAAAARGEVARAAASGGSLMAREAASKMAQVPLGAQRIVGTLGLVDLQ